MKDIGTKYSAQPPTGHHLLRRPSLSLRTIVAAASAVPLPTILLYFRHNAHAPLLFAAAAAACVRTRSTSSVVRSVACALLRLSPGTVRVLIINTYNHFVLRTCTAFPYPSVVRERTFVFRYAGFGDCCASPPHSFVRRSWRHHAAGDRPLHEVIYIIVVRFSVFVMFFFCFLQHSV